MGVERRAADRIDDGIDLVALAKRVEGRERHADLGPERAEDELPAPGRVNGLHELAVLPRVDSRAVERRAGLEQLGELGNGRLLLARAFGLPIALAVFTVETMFVRSRSGSIERTVAN